PGAARPVTDVLQPAEDFTIGSRLQILRDPGEVHRERERLHAGEHVLQREEELQQEPAVEIHRARDVAEQHESHLALLAPPVAQLDDLAPREIRAQRAPQIHAAAPSHRPAPPADPTGQPACDLHGQPQDLLELLGPEGREVACGQRLLLGARRYAQWIAALLFFFLAPALQGQPLAARAPDVARAV